MSNSKLIPLALLLTVASPSWAQFGAFPTFPYAQTAPLDSSSATVGSPAIWLHPTTLTKSLLLTVDGTTSLNAYDISGNGAALATLAGAYTDVDVTYQFPLAGSAQALIAARATDGTVRFFTVDPTTRALHDVSASPPLTLSTGGGCLRLARPADAPGTWELWTTSGVKLERWRIRADAGVNLVTADLLASAPILVGDVAGCAADEAQGVLYVSEATLGLARARVFLDGGSSVFFPATLGTGPLVNASSVGALGLYRAAAGQGDIVLATEGAIGNGNTLFMLFDRATNGYVSSFTILDSGTVGAVHHSAGLALANLPVDARAPGGTLVAHDAENGVSHPNFKLVSWSTIADGANATDGGGLLPVPTDTTFDPRALTGDSDGGATLEDAGHNGVNNGSGGAAGPGIKRNPTPSSCACSTTDASGTVLLFGLILARALLRRRDSIDFDA